MRQTGSAGTRERTDEVSALFETAAVKAARFRQAIPNRPQRPELTYAEALTTFEEPSPDAGMPRRSGDRWTRRECDAQACMPRRVHASSALGHRGLPSGWRVAADWLTSAWGQNAGNHTAAPAAAACEAVASGWLSRRFGPAARGIGRVCHRRDGRELRLPCGCPTRDIAAGRVGR